MYIHICMYSGLLQRTFLDPVSLDMVKWRQLSGKCQILCSQCMKGPKDRQVKLKFNLYHIISFFIKLFNLQKANSATHTWRWIFKQLHFLLSALSKWNPQPASCISFFFLLSVYIRDVLSWKLQLVCKHQVLGSIFFQRKIAISKLIKIIFCHNKLLWHKKVQTRLF